LTIGLKILSKQSISQSINHFFRAPKIDQRAGQLSLPHVGMTKISKT